RKIRDAQMEKVPYMIVVGDRDMEAGTLAPRHRSEGDLGTMQLADFLAILKDDVYNKRIK
ncbi:MAG: threonine--tRNA ligase, partial [Firmicutes bacterium]|nr:threonine--tRNA ligase [Bacillota bacterium]